MEGNSTILFILGEKEVREAVDASGDGEGEKVFEYLQKHRCTEPIGEWWYRQKTIPDNFY